MKRFICIIIVAVLGMSGCGRSSGDAVADAAEESEERDAAEPDGAQSVEEDADDGESEMEADNSAVAGEPAKADDVTAKPGMDESGRQADGAWSGDPDGQTEEPDGFSFADVEGWQFKFSSGSGGWYTALDIYADGSFEGTYHDADIGETGEGYPNGTVRHSDFSGHFTSPEQVDDTTYVFQIADISYAHETGEEIDSEEGVLYVYTDAYGLENAENLYLYLPGSRLTELPEYFLNWTGYANYGQEALERYRLPFYGLFNEAAQEGFSSAVYKTEMTAAEQIWQRIEAAESQSADAEYELYEIAGQSQDELEEAASRLYSAWDDALNDIWDILKADLDEETMSRLTDEERGWIQEKEAAAKDAGEKYGDDPSTAGIQSSVTAAGMTQERVYDLAEYAQ